MKTQYKPLTERQGQYLQGVLEGKKRQTIARELGVNRQAVTCALQVIQDKWGFLHRHELVAYAEKHNILQAIKEGTYQYKLGMFQYR